MTTNAVTLTLPVNRSADIVAKLRGAVMAAHSIKVNADAAREDATKAAGNATAARELLMVAFCDGSIDGNWMVPEIDSATVALAKEINDEKAAKSLATMLSEVKLAAYPLVRGSFAELRAVRDECWDEEDIQKAIDKKAGVKHTGLLASVFSRRYQTLVAMCRAINKAEPKERPNPGITTKAGFMAWVATKDPSRDPAKLAERVAASRDSLNEILGLVGAHAHLSAVVDALAFVTADSLSAAMFPPREITATPEVIETKQVVSYPEAPPAPVVEAPVVEAKPTLTAAERRKAQRAAKKAVEEQAKAEGAAGASVDASAIDELLDAA